MMSGIVIRCYSQRKVKNSESKSQLLLMRPHRVHRCYSQRKVKNSESKSQLVFVVSFSLSVLLFTA